MPSREVVLVGRCESWRHTCGTWVSVVRDSERKPSTRRSPARGRSLERGTSLSGLGSAAPTLESGKTTTRWEVLQELPWGAAGLRSQTCHHVGVCLGSPSCRCRRDGGGVTKIHFVKTRSEIVCTISKYLVLVLLSYLLSL